jgi:queuine tRNA-ribosyltransferase
MSIQTPHGCLQTPTFMPVGTRANVNCMTSDQLNACGSQIILGGNTYHMLVSPGMDIIQSIGGMHQLMGWHKPMLTDSGGFQVFSLSKNKKICTIDENGAQFKHPTTGQIIRLTPKISIETQKIIGADIIMAFDECTPENDDYQRAICAMDRTHRWLAESVQTHQKHPCSVYGKPQALFGIIQGGSYQGLRKKSTEYILDINPDGIAIGGESIGFDMVKTLQILDWVVPMLPEHKPRYTMGVGLSPQDLIDVTQKGIDLFDCVAPTRNARHGALYHGYVVPKGNWLSFDSNENRHRILIKKSIYAKDERPILTGCRCYTCQNHSRAYLHYLFKRNQALYAPLACIHNIQVMHNVCEKIREHIRASSSTNT